MKKLFMLVFASCSVLVACGGIKGLLNVHDEITLKSNWNRSITIGSGQYKSVVEVNRNQSRISLKVEVAENRTKEFYFNFPSGQELPSGNEDFQLSAEDSGQQYDLSGSIATEEWRTETVEGNESCTYEREVRRCYRDREGREHCRWERETRHGRQDVEYHFEYTKKDLEVRILSPQTNDEVSSYSGTRTDEYKRYDYQGRCW